MPRFAPRGIRLRPTAQEYVSLKVYVMCSIILNRASHSFRPDVYCGIANEHVAYKRLEAHPGHPKSETSELPLGPWLAIRESATRPSRLLVARRLGTTVLSRSQRWYTGIQTTIFSAMS